MPAPELTVKVPGETADTSAVAATTTPPDERLAAVLTLSKQTVAVISEALPGLVAGDLIALRDLEVAGDNRKGVLAAIEAEDKRRAELGSTDPIAPADPLPADLCVVIAGALFDFAGFLTTRDKVIALGASEEAGAAVEAIEEWAATRGLSLDEAAVGGWRELGVDLVEAAAQPPIPVAELPKAEVNAPRTAGQAVLTPDGWVVPEPQPKA
ncbi:hypothetical protein B9Y88_15140 [Stenotrophomonas maltophilia]|uniref:hypothetical protein n=1 Tax=Stenotrophomonas TaxID=40323 RepID=UPI000C267F3E|nr:MULTISPECIES: hypothetical protein [unclassified Stenotrophomonas]MDH1243202.1 hypothetical protein [Stenotrophomonas sp. GD03948]MDH1577488.1 hypothetical protein [Stenotrophomonas sp. GD03744]PJL77219.1 hypothetical protein B9Y88_15140 [Stenotrophomonas maltophilia]PZQ29457.1 MAG: hypothetical protein DI562_08845 [Stenotrophomonas acidaminiphila]